VRFIALPGPSDDEVTEVLRRIVQRLRTRIPWAELLLRVFREDVLLCSCGGRRVVLAFITEKKVVKVILETWACPPPARRSRPRERALQAKTHPGRTTCPSCSNRCGDDSRTGPRVCLDFALRGGVCTPQPRSARLTKVSRCEKRGGGDGTGLIRPTIEKWVMGFRRAEPDRAVEMHAGSLDGGAALDDPANAPDFCHADLHSLVEMRGRLKTDPKALRPPAVPRCCLRA
jgi:hypothetical protein